MGRHFYVHIPFCEAKCPYCSFYSVAGSKLQKEYFDALIKEIKNTKDEASDDPSEKDTIYFGGGTPSVPDEAYIASVLGEIITVFNVSDAEITIEANPHSLTAKKAIAYKKAGFNRISLGVQSLHETTLKTLGRLHDRKTALDAIEIIKGAGFNNISADLMTGVPGQTIEDVLEDAKTLIDAGITHISTYSLSIDEGTPFEKRYGTSLEDPDVEIYERQMYHTLRKFLEEHSFIPYEISNSAKEGFRSRHNSSYWRGVEYYGFGAGSHGYIKGIRYGHEDDIEKYIKDPTRKIVEEKLTEEDKMAEYAMLMLRTMDGITEEGFKARFGKSIPDDIKSKMRRLIDKGLCEKIKGGICLSRKGLDLANEAFMEFL